MLEVVDKILESFLFTLDLDNDSIGTVQNISAETVPFSKVMYKRPESHTLDYPGNFYMFNSLFVILHAVKLVVKWDTFLITCR